MTRNEEGRSATEISLALIALILWPAFLVMFVLERLRPAVVSQKERIEQIRTYIELLAFPQGSTASLFEFREVLYRYTGLAGSAEDHRAEHPFGELLAVGGREVDDVSLTCLLRRNRQRIEFHTTLARNEFIDLLTELSQTTGIKSLEIVEHALELARLINDTAAADELSALHNMHLPADQSAAEPTEREVWKAHTRSASNIN